MILAGRCNISCTDGHLEAPQPILEEDKMGMIAFYAGLFIGVLYGLLISSLLAFYLVKNPRGLQPNQPEGYSQVDPR
jgi:hypothetical protein